MIRRRAAATGGSAGQAGWLVVVALAALACGGGEPGVPSASPSTEPGAEPPAAGPGEPAAPGAPLRSHTVELYFPARLGNGLVGEYSEIYETAAPGDRIKQIVTELVSGPTNNEEALPALPSGTRLRQVYVLDDGTAYLDFTADLREGISGGSMEELLTVYAIVDSVVQNVAEVKRVGILIEGQVVETLNGHMDLRRPLRPDLSLVLVPTVVDAARRSGAGKWGASVVVTL